MLLPLINTVLLLLMLVVSAIKDQLGDPLAQWAKTAHLLILGTALILAVVVLLLLSQSNTVVGVKALCDILIPCFTPTP